MKNSHKLIVLFVSAQLLLLSGCTPEPSSPPSNTPVANPSNPSVGGNSTPERKCLQMVIDYKVNLRKLDESKVTLTNDKVTSALISPKIPSFAQDLNGILTSKDCTALPEFSRIKNELSSLKTLTDSMPNIQGSRDTDVVKKMLATPIDPPVADTDDSNSLARKFVIYTEQKLDAISSTLIGSDSVSNSEFQKLRERVNKLEIKITELESRLPTPNKTSPTSSPKIMLPEKKDEQTNSSLFSTITNLIGFGALAIIVGGVVYMLRGKEILLDLFKSSRNRGGTKNTGRNNKRGLGSRGDSQSASHSSGNLDDWRKNQAMDRYTSGSGDQYGQDRHDELNETVDNINTPVKKPPESNTPTSISQANQDLPRQKIQPINQVTHFLTYEQAFNIYHEDYRILEPYMQNGYYSATVESITLNRQYSESPLQLSACPKYKSLFWIIETSDYGAILFPNPEVRIDQSRIQALKYFFNNKNFKDSNYQAWKVLPALMKVDSKSQFVRQKKGELSFDY